MSDQEATLSLSADKLEEIRVAFIAADHDSDGVIPMDTLGQVLSDIGENPSQEVLQGIVSKVEFDREGKFNHLNWL